MAFFAFVLDVHSRFLVGWQFAGHMRDTLVIDALEMAVGQRHPDPELELVHHSDRGSQYGSEDFADALLAHEILASVGSTGDAFDNAMAESLVDSFKTELIADRVWRTRAQLEFAIVASVGWYRSAGRDRAHPGPSHTTGRAGPHPAVRSAFPEAAVGIQESLQAVAGPVGVGQGASEDWGA